MERSPGKQLFIDDYFIESLTGARAFSIGRENSQLTSLWISPSISRGTRTFRSRAGSSTTSAAGAFVCITAPGRGNRHFCARSNQGTG